MSVKQYQSAANRNALRSQQMAHQLLGLLIIHNEAEALDMSVITASVRYKANGNLHEHLTTV